MIWIIYFLAAWGLSYIMGIAQISLSLRVLLGGIPASPAVPAQKVIDIAGNSVTIHPALDAREEVAPVIPVVGPFLVDLLECPACSGFWIGIAGSFWLPMVLGGNPVAWSVIMGCATCGVNFLIANIAFRGRTHG